MEERYLTPNLVVKDNITYYINDKQKTIKITKNNWHKYMNEYGWEKLDGGWIRRLNKHSENKNKNSCWGLLDCGGDGDCLFYAVAEAIGEPDMQTIREIAAKQITDENFDIIIESYRTAYDSGEFIFEWNPYEIITKDNLREELQKTGHNYWGDHIVVQLLEKALNINFIILNTENEVIKRGTLKERFSIHSLATEFNPNRKTIILYYIDSEHFKLVGYFNETHMQMIFDDIPMELWSIYREDCCCL